MPEVSQEVKEAIQRHHSSPTNPGKCSSMQIQLIRAPLPAVWSLIHRFDWPQAYKTFLRSCSICHGDGVGPGSVREVGIATGLPATISRERLDVLDDDRHLMSFSIIGGNHQLNNYRSTVTVHEVEGGQGTVVVESYVVDVPPRNTKKETCIFVDGGQGTVVVESYVVDVPPRNTKKETCIFVDTIIRCNLKTLAMIVERNCGVV